MKAVPKLLSRYRGFTQKLRTIGEQRGPKTEMTHVGLTGRKEEADLHPNTKNVQQIMANCPGTGQPSARFMDK